MSYDGADGFGIAVLITCHNRCATTLVALDCLYSQVLDGVIQLQTYLVDDGCTDDTAISVAQRFPKVRLIQGDGQLYWNQGMRLAWTSAENGEYNAFLWLNDDTNLLPGALQGMVATLFKQEESTGSRGIVVGSCCTPRKPRAEASQGKGDELVPGMNQQLKLTYGGRDSNGLVYPGNYAVPVSTFNGNLVLVSREAHSVLGNLSSQYHHSFGDMDYGIRASRAGIPVWLAPGFLAECPTNAPPDWRNPYVNLFKRVNIMRSPKGISRNELRHFMRTQERRGWVLQYCRYCLQMMFPRLAGKWKSFRDF